MNALQQYLHQHVDVNRFYREELDDYYPGQNAICPFHDDANGSLSIDTEGVGQYYCHSAACGARGTSFVGFYVQKYGVPYELALQEIYAKYIRPIIPVQDVLDNHKRLLEIPIIHAWLLEHRGITLDTIKYFKLGHDGQRITIPIENQFEMIVNQRRYDITKKSDAKMVSHAQGYGGACLFPSFNLAKDTVVLVEGEWDAMLGNQYSVPCICSTGGAGYWTEEFSQLLSGKNVIVLLDNDDAGRKGTEIAVSSLSNYASTVRIAEYPYEGCDLTDFLVKYKESPDALKTLVAKAKIAHINPNAGQDVLYTRIKLQDATNPRYRGKPIEFKACVIGKDTQPYYVPKRYRATCLTRPERRCPSCSGVEAFVSEHKVSLGDESILSMVATSENGLQKRMKMHARCKKSCEVEMEVLETVCCEEVKLVAPLDEIAVDEDFKYVVRIGYVIGQEVSANATYIFRGYPYPDPDTQHVVFLLYEAEPAADQLDHYQLTDSDIELLRRQFPGSVTLNEIHEFLDDLYSYLAVTQTKIYERRALHQAVDLVFHSALSFEFNGEDIRRGWLDVLVIGDTRTGKGYVTERLCRYYGAGEVASGENCTFSGLVGGVQQLGARKSWVVTWGFIPRNDRRLGVIDEAGSVASDTLSRMSRVRSEGIAEVFKIVTERTLARTRLIWNANPSDGRSIREFEHGVESVRTMTDKNEDIARFDYAMVVSSDEIDPTIINAERSYAGNLRPELQEACRKLIQWIWSRRPGDIKFDPDAVHVILANATRLGQAYHPSIPLIQIENIRVKLAKISCAIAGRIFSSDESGMKIIVTKECAEYAVGFLEHIYTRDTCAYDVYSGLKREQGTLKDEDALLQQFAVFKEAGKDWVNDLLDNPKLTVKGIEAVLNVDIFTAKEVRNTLMRCRAVKQEHSYWVKREPFIRFLRNLRIRYVKDPEWWKEVL